MTQPNPVSTFLNEADELLSQIEEVVLDLSGIDLSAASHTEEINHLFRAFHTIKGSGAMFGFDAVARFTHHVESTLDRVRDGAMPLSRELLDAVLASKDQIRILLDCPAEAGAEAEAKGQSIIENLHRLLTGSHATGVSGSVTTTDRIDTSAVRQSQIWNIRFVPGPELMAFGTDPILLLNELRSLGECRVVAHTEKIPSLHSIQPDHCFLWWEIAIRTNAGLNALRDVFIFVEDSSEVIIHLAEPQALEQVVAAPAASRMEHGTEEHPVASPETRSDAGRRNSLRDSTVRVPAEKLDRLVNLVGELVMNQSRLTQAASKVDSTELAVPVEEIERLVSELRDSVLGIRMMPIGTTFSRFKRLVHDLSQELGKEIEMVTDGADTELDKTVLDQLGDPMVHLIRNSIDHGIEPAEERVQKGKSRSGTIRLTAVHTGSNVVVSIQDDGRGLNSEAIRLKAVERQLISPETALSEKDIYSLIFLPGFSTAKQVTSVSGRGVGMDVVKRQIDALRGSITVSSEEGQGTTISLTLPLTLAIIDGLLIEVARDQFIVPMSVVMENVELQRADRSRNNGRNVISVRGELIPYIDLRKTFHMIGDEPAINRIVILRREDQRVGLLVDRILGSHQTVIQSLGRFYRDIEVFSGATIMGDGRVALIVDVAGLIRHADRLCSRPLDSSARTRILTSSQFDIQQAI
jgi:two-component system chemotaxis sensor kinase CheA